MYTQCPHCHAIFQVSTSQLKAADGDVRCGQCLTIFSALHHLSEDIPAQTENPSWNPAQDDERDDSWAADTPNTATTETTEASAALFITETPAHQAPGETPLTDKLQADTASHDETGIDSSDIFNEVIIEASQHHLPTEEIDRFEAFLSDDTPLPADADADINIATPVTGFEEIITVDDVKLGDVEDVTAELDTELDIERYAEDVDDDFSEFDEFFGTTDEKADEATTEDATLKTRLQTPLETIAEKETESLYGLPASSDLDAYTAHEAIIIEEADLAPISSGAYTDSPGVDTDSDAIAANADTDPLSDGSAGQGPENTTSSPEETIVVNSTSAGEASHADQPEAHGIPSILLEEFHAAKAEQLRPSNTPWVIGSLVLMLTLMLQVVYHSRNELAKDASLRPWLVQMCKLADCSLTQPYDIKQIDIIGREVRSHPTARKALIASTTLINNADFVQPFPLLTVIFSDINGKKIAQRRFTPREYLHNSIDLAAGMTPDTPVRIELELVDPGKAAVNYEFQPELDPRNTRSLN